jgi:methionine biosynthesis protein MetW
MVSIARPGNNGIRFDLHIIASWIENGSRVLDLGCGEGDLLYYLREHKQVDGTGIEIREERVAECIAKGVSVLQGDINEELPDYPDLSFDYVILSQTLQQVYDPEQLIREILRIAKRGIVSFPNFSHWRIRLQLLLTGYAPVTEELPYQWYDTPNIRVITLKDFRRFAHQVGFEIHKEVAVGGVDPGGVGQIVRVLPTYFATYGIFLIGNRDA